MKNLQYMLPVILIVAAVIAVYALFLRPALSLEKALETITSNEEAVEISVTPKLSKEAWAFEVSLNTHSVELAYDLREITTLVDDKGNVYKPLTWEGDPPGGHHLGGVLKFKPIVPQPESIELNINLGGKKRSFRWTL